MQFHKHQSPSYINDGKGWRREDALVFLRDHGLSFVQPKEDDQRLKFTQQKGPHKLGQVRVSADGLPQGVSTVVEVA